VVLDAESAADVAALLGPLDPGLAASHAAAPSAPRVAALCLLHAWAAATGAGDAAAAAAWRRLFALATTDPELSAERYLFWGATHWRKVRLWQALAALPPVAAAAGGGGGAPLAALLRVLSLSNAGDVKRYQLTP
jgi:hypothetical protein